jgi:hypothetical protein
MMNKIHKNDQETIEDIRQALEILAGTRSKLGQTRSCACDRAGMCSLHSQVHTRLISAANELARAIGDLQNKDGR